MPPPTSAPPSATNALHLPLRWRPSAPGSMPAAHRPVGSNDGRAVQRVKRNRVALHDDAMARLHLKRWSRRGEGSSCVPIAQAV